MKKVAFGMLAAMLVLGSVQDGRAEAGAAAVYRVAADSLTVREEPSGKADVVGYLNAGDTVTVTDEKYGWMKVKGSGVSGWSAGYYLTKSSSSGSSAAASGKADKDDDVHIQSAGDAGVVTGNSVRLRKGPGTGYAILGSVDKGDKVKLLASDGGWYKVETASGTVAWMSGDYVDGSGGTAGTSSSAAEPAKHGGLRGKVIVVDPGHGGTDPGMIGTTKKTLEKDLTLSTSLLLRDRLQALGAKVIMTRTKDDQKPELAERVRISESAHADAFVSVHFNSSTKNTSGTLTFYYSQKKDAPLAHAIEGRLGKNRTGLKDNGISFGDFHVLRENDRPAALVELGFLTNASDESLVRKSSFQHDAANAIADGLADYFS